MNSSKRMAFAIICALVGSIAWVLVFLSEIPPDTRIVIIDVITYIVMAFFIWIIVEAIIISRQK